VRRTAIYIDGIIQGTRPGDTPIEQISKFEFIIDLPAARAMGIQVPQDLLLRADEVIR
jgi:putative ABC transport system substrate-binding protein